MNGSGIGKRIYGGYKEKYYTVNLGLFNNNKEVKRGKIMVYAKKLRGGGTDIVTLRWLERACGHVG